MTISAQKPEPTTEPTARPAQTTRRGAAKLTDEGAELTTYSAPATVVVVSRACRVVSNARVGLEIDTGSDFAARGMKLDEKTHLGAPVIVMVKEASTVVDAVLSMEVTMCEQRLHSRFDSRTGQLTGKDGEL